MMKYKVGIGNSRRRHKTLLAFVIVVLLVAGAVFFGLHKLYQTNLQAVDPNASTEIVFVLESGSTTPQIAKGLKAKELIRSTAAFEQYVRTNELGEAFKAGTYLLMQSQDVPAIVNILTEGKVAANLFTIFPGTNLDQIKASFIEKGYSEAEVDAALDPALYVGHPALVDKPAGADLEGYLYPDSYELLLGTTKVETIIGQSLDEMAEALTPEVRAGMATQGLSVYQGITLASIVEREVGAVDKDGNPTDNRVKAAQVFIKRLKIGMMLQSNATDGYPAEYDTYTIPGLPPGPISNVTKNALQAVASPAQTDYLYFVSGKDCITRFSAAIDQHEALKSEHGIARPEDNCRG